MIETVDVEHAIVRVLGDGPLTLDQLRQRLPEEIRAEERRRNGVAVHRMLGDGRLRAAGCDHDIFGHDDACVIEVDR
jgi:hypothetical protein